MKNWHLHFHMLIYIIYDIIYIWCRFRKERSFISAHYVVPRQMSYGTNLINLELKLNEKRIDDASLAGPCWFMLVVLLATTNVRNAMMVDGYDNNED